VTGEGVYPLAPLGRRVAAWLIDAGLGAVLALGFVELAGGGSDLTAMWHAAAFKSVTGKAGHDLSAAMNPATAGWSTLEPIIPLLAILLAVTLGAVGYRVVTTAKWGAGIGKAALGLRVIADIATEAEPELPGWKRSWKRWAVPQVPGLIPLPATGLLAYLPAFRDTRRRGLHDRAAGTVVIDIRTPIAASMAVRAVAAPLDFAGPGAPTTVECDETGLSDPVAGPVSSHSTG
jgi:hypothetical protein